MAITGDGFLVVATIKNMNVPVEVEVCSSQPINNFGLWDHIVQCGIDVTSPNYLCNSEEY